MNKRSLVCLALLAAFAAPPASVAQEIMPLPDDCVILNIAAEGWVTTKTAHVLVSVEAAVSGNSVGLMRTDMLAAVNELAKGDWRLTTFTRSQDQTGLERWSAEFETRLPEADLNGLAEKAKKASKAGMQLSVGDIDFSPTLAEIEATRATVRTQIYKQANDQLAALNAAMPGRSYRIAQINFIGDTYGAPMPYVKRGQSMAMMPSNASANAAMAPVPEEPLERAEKITLSARVEYAVAPPPSSSSSSLPPDMKH